MKLHNFPSRLAAGAFILNAGLGKLSAEPETAEGLHGMATGTYPFLGSIPASRFVRILAISEIALGSALLVPFVPDRKAGFALTAFAASLLGLYLRTPGMREEGTIRPTQQGTPIAKDVWLLGTGLSLLLDRARPRSSEAG
ncbi:MAG TPA: hypothetical protein VMU75_16035 [Acidimicrobiales bacterium]|nr:hypothetical protein [Acidimicrobiales bacterium]